MFDKIFGILSSWVSFSKSRSNDLKVYCIIDGFVILVSVIYLYNIDPSEYVSWKVVCAVFAVAIGCLILINLFPQIYEINKEELNKADKVREEVRNKLFQYMDSCAEFVDACTDLAKAKKNEIEQRTRNNDSIKQPSSDGQSIVSGNKD